MDWVQWAIPLVAVAVFIISNLIKNKQDEAQRPPLTRPRNEDGGDQPATRRTPEEIDRFLEEVRRRKKIAEQQQQGQREKPARPVVTERPRPVPPPLSAVVVQPAPPPERPRAVEQPQPRPRPQAPVVRTPTPVRKQEIDTIPMAEAIDIPVAMPPPAATASGAHTSNAVLTLRSLLRNRQNLAAAIMLKEVLDKPRCKRSRL